MRRIYIVTVVVLILGALIFAYSKEQQRRPPQVPEVTSLMTNEQRLQSTITTQQRINRYFHGSVIPKLRNCWSRVQGPGTIEIVHTYTRDANGKWVVEKLAAGKSTLPRGQDAVALQCMQDAVRGSSFPVESDDGDSTKYDLRWTWPVPFPANMAEQTRVMFEAKNNGGGTGCDSKGTPPACDDCKTVAGELKCVEVCKGYKTCELNQGHTARGYQSCITGWRCSTGGPTGVAGGSVIY